MASVNKTTLLGNVGRDPDIRYTPAGTAVANFSLATNEKWTDKAGEKQERAEWHRLVAWARLAEIVGEYVKKGRQLYIEGRLQTRKWTDKENIDRWVTEVVVLNMQLLGNGNRVTHSADAEEAPEGVQDGQEPITIPEDDIPF